MLDPASLQVLISRLTGIADEMGNVLRRAATSPNIKERADCSAALFTAEGELLVQAEHIPVHLGSMPAAVQAAIGACGARIRRGDDIVLNDPFAGGTHLNDVTLVTPCFSGTELVGWAANRAHHADLGGMAPGSMPADATEIAQEGLRLPPVLLTPEVEAVFVASSRTPDERRGDLAAQRGANARGVERLVELRHEPFAEVLDYGQRRMRAALGELPDGCWSATDIMDSVGSAPAQQSPSRILLTLTIAGDEARFDFTGTDRQRAGNANAVEAVTASAVAYALRAATDPTIPANAGTLRSVQLVAPAGSLVAARAPVAVGAGNVEVSQRVADVCLRALAHAAPDRLGAASQGTMNNVLIGADGDADGRGPFVYYETIGGGQGGRPHRGGMSGVHTNMTNTRDTPVEALERAYPMRVRRYTLRRHSGGAGEHPGGEGIERELELAVDATVSLITERRVSRPWGLAGGEPGAPGENWLLPSGDETRAERLPDKCTIAVRAGDVLRILTPGGGGWGHPPLPDP
ncbi:MAG TPA: hydantoinase B/oxoprolinase family protein [Acidimicrobiia bacterium]|nr:hydantoinase B/oxoprolinase family protein [Acidimicrobiia bacterium]